MIGEGALALLLITSLPSLTLSGPDTPLQVPGNGPLATQAIFRPRLSADGRYVLFATASDEFDSSDSNGFTDFYRLDRAAGSYQRVSGSAEVQGNSSAASGVISADGQVVAFHSAATNLVADDNNGVIDVFIWQSGQQLQRISAGVGGVLADGSSLNPALSGDGRYVAFSSFASNLVANDENGSSDIFVHDRQSGITQRVSVSSNGEQGDRGSFQPSISVDGRYVAFTSEATNFSDNEFDQLPDLFLFDRSTQVIQLVNQSTSGVRANADSAAAVLSPDGSAVAFFSRATTLEPGLENIFFDVFVRDLLSLRTDLVSAAGDEPANANSFNPAISSRGQWIAFQSEAGNLSTQDGNTFSDIYVVNRFNGQSHIASRRATGTSANEGSFSASITSDGATVSFESAATDLTPTGSAATSGYLAVGPIGAVDSLAVLPPPGQELAGSVNAANISPDGRYVSVVTAADNVLPGDINGQPDAFLIDLSTRQVRLASRGADGGFVDGADAAPTIAMAVSSDGCRTAMASAIDSAQLGVNPAIVDGNSGSDLFLRDDCAVGPPRVGSLVPGRLVTGSLPSLEPNLSADGRWLVFVSAAEEFQDLPGPPGVRQIFRQSFDDPSERQQISTVQGVGAEFSSAQPQLSADGSVIVFVSADPQLDPLLEDAVRPAAGVEQVYRFDGLTGRLALLSAGFVGDSAGPPNGASFQPSISADGNTVVFTSRATNLTLAGTPPGQRLFVWRADDQGGGMGSVTSLPATNNSPGLAQNPKLSADGMLLAFSSDDPNLVADDNNGLMDVFATDLVTGDLVAVGRQSDGSLSANGGLRPLTVSREGKTYQLAYLAISDVGSAVRFQPIVRSVPTAVIDFSIESPLQSVERGHFRLQVRNTGGVPIDVGEQLTVSLEPLDHVLVDLTQTPRWRCSVGPPVICEFIGDVLLGGQIPPGAAEMLTFEFDMFAGSQPLVSGAHVMMSGQSTPLAISPDLITERVQSGVFVTPQSSAELAPGVTGLSQVSIINGGQQVVTELSVDVAPLIFGEPFHVFTPAPTEPWSCLPVEDPELPPLTTRCTYSGPAIAPNDEVLLTSSLVLPPGVGRLLTRISVTSDAEVISPASVQLMVTEAPGLIFRSGFEG